MTFRGTCVSAKRMCCPEHRKTRFPIFQKNRETGFSVFIWWTIWGSNPRPQRCERCALPAELIARVCLTQLTCRSDSYYTTFCGRCHLLFRIFPQSFSCRNLAGPPRKNLRAAAVFLLSGGRRGSVFYAVSGIFRRLPSLRPVRSDGRRRIRLSARLRPAYIRSRKVRGAKRKTSMLATMQYRTQKSMVIRPNTSVDIRTCIRKKQTRYVTHRII